MRGSLFALMLGLSLLACGRKPTSAGKDAPVLATSRPQPGSGAAPVTTAPVQVAPLPLEPCDPRQSFVAQVRRKSSSELIEVHPGGERRVLARHGVPRLLSYSPRGWIAGAPGFRRLGTQDWLPAPSSFLWLGGVFDRAAEKFFVFVSQDEKPTVSGVQLVDVKSQKAMKIFRQAEDLSISPVDDTVYLLFLDEMVSKDGKPSEECWEKPGTCQASKRSLWRLSGDKRIPVKRFGDEDSDRAGSHHAVVAVDRERYFLHRHDAHTARYFDEHDRPLVPHAGDLQPSGELLGGSFTWTQQNGLSISADGGRAVLSEGRNAPGGAALLDAIVVVDLVAQTRSYPGLNGLHPVLRDGYIVFSADPERVQLPAERQKPDEELDIRHWALYAYHLESSKLCQLGTFDDLDAKDEAVFPM
jgi:hypothetical protein